MPTETFLSRSQNGADVVAPFLSAPLLVATEGGTMGFFGLFGGGFNPSKCKTALRLCIGRIKLLKNKKGLAARALRKEIADLLGACLLYTSPSPRDQRGSRMPSSA